jgi:DNA-directed RNA polymerase specialized sigma24 family protein
MNEISTQDLAKLCREESERYRRNQPDDQGHCYELFRRAIVDRDQEAWTAVYEQYQRLVGKWVDGSADQIDKRINQTFAKFWQAVDDRAGFVNRFTRIGKIMAFLRMCARSVRVDEHRREGKHQHLISLQDINASTGDTTSERVIDSVVQQELLEHVERRLHDEQEQLVISLSFKVGLAPRQIAQEHPDVFADAKKVRRIKERVVLRLSNDLRLQDWWRGQTHLGKDE